MRVLRSDRARRRRPRHPGRFPTAAHRSSSRRGIGRMAPRRGGGRAHPSPSHGPKDSLRPGCGRARAARTCGVGGDRRDVDRRGATWLVTPTRYVGIRSIRCSFRPMSASKRSPPFSPPAPAARSRFTSHRQCRRCLRNPTRFDLMCCRKRGSMVPDGLTQPERTKGDKRWRHERQTSSGRSRRWGA